MKVQNIWWWDQRSTITDHRLKCPDFKLRWLQIDNDELHFANIQQLNNAAESRLFHPSLHDWFIYVPERGVRFLELRACRSATDVQIDDTIRTFPEPTRSIFPGPLPGAPCFFFAHQSPKLYKARSTSYIMFSNVRLLYFFFQNHGSGKKWELELERTGSALDWTAAKWIYQWFLCVYSKMFWFFFCYLLWVALLSFWRR